MRDSQNDLIWQIEEKTGLQFLEDETDGNICFRHNNSELQNEFKSGFTLRDFQFFLASFAGKDIEIPEDSENFWKRVEKGSSI